MNSRVAIVLLALPGLAAAQAMVEYGLGAGRAAVSSAPAANAASGIAGAFNKLNNAVGKTADAKPAGKGAAPAPAAARQSPAAPGAPAGPSASAPAAAAPSPEPTWEAPSGIAQGMELSEVLGRFGPPSLKLTTDRGDEAFSYVRKDLVVNIALRDGVVIAVQKTERPDHAIVVLR